MDIDDGRRKPRSLSRRALSHMLVGGSAMGLLAVGPNAAAQLKPRQPVNVQDQLEIERLIYRHAMALDNRDAEAFADCFAAGVFTLEQVERIMEFHRRYEYTVHNIVNHLYTVQERTATGTAYCTISYVKRTTGKLTQFDMYSRYEDQLIKQDDRWLFLKRRGGTLFSTEEVPVQEGLPPGFWDATKSSS